jgi:hypothetical protein
MNRVETIGSATIYLGDCRDVLPELQQIVRQPDMIGWDGATA